jgi:hypothetical protein
MAEWKQVTMEIDPLARSPSAPAAIASGGIFP